MTFMAVPAVFQPRIGTMNRPLTRPPATLSPSERERDGVRGRFIEFISSRNTLSLYHRMV